MMANPEQNNNGQEPGKKVKKKKPTGILKDLVELKRYYMSNDDLVPEGYLIEHKKGAFVEWSDVEKIIKKYS
jgi:hypothetical protein